jgi:hypothetical protein
VKSVVLYLFFPASWLKITWSFYTVCGGAELSHAPKNNANKISESVKKRLLKLKEKYKYRGAYKIPILYAAKHPGEHAPARSAVEEFFKEEKGGRPAAGAGGGERAERCAGG